MFPISPENSVNMSNEISEDKDLTMNTLERFCEHCYKVREVRLAEFLNSQYFCEVTHSEKSKYAETCAILLLLYLFKPKTDPLATP